jgi:hypothetical protein
MLKGGGSRGGRRDRTEEDDGGREWEEREREGNISG